MREVCTNFYRITFGNYLVLDQVIFLNKHVYVGLFIPIKL